MKDRDDNVGLGGPDSRRELLPQRLVRLEPDSLKYMDFIESPDRPLDIFQGLTIEVNQLNRVHYPSVYSTSPTP